jgi:hypothetical protein
VPNEPALPVTDGGQRLRERSWVPVEPGPPVVVNLSGAPRLASATRFAYTFVVEFIESPIFTQLLSGYMKDDQFQRLQVFLALDPEAGDVMPGTGGCRKVRWADRRRGKGKRGGLRVIYYYLLKDMQIWLLTLYDKDEVTDLSAREKRLLKAMIEEEMHQRSRRHRPGGK